MRRAVTKASHPIQMPAASLPSEVEPCNGEQVRPKSARVMLARSLRSCELMANDGWLCTEDHECLQGFSGSAYAELAITEVFS